MSSSFDPIWDEIYNNGQENRYPWDSVVSFVFRNKPKLLNNSDINILEVGCGTASNLWFAAREGFNCFGIDGAKAAIDKAKSRLDLDGLSADLRVGDFTSLPFESASMDLVIDRASITCCGKVSSEQAISEIHRVLKDKGRMLFNPYADDHSSLLYSKDIEDDLMFDITKGSLKGVGQIRFYSIKDIYQLFNKDFWNVLSVKKINTTESLGEHCGDVHSEWQVIVEKIG